MTQSKELNFKGQNIYIGLDVHLKSWTVTVLSEVSVLKTFSQDPSPDKLYKYLTNNYPGAEYHSVYEAGFCGFWIHHRLTELGVNNIVVNPADVPTMGSEKLRKTDAVDSKKLAVGLRAKQLREIYIPDDEAIEIRSLVRLRGMITKDTTRQKNRIKSYLRYIGIEIPKEFTGPSFHWPQRFLDWISTVSVKTSSGRQTLDMHIKRLKDLHTQNLEVIRALRALSKTERFNEMLTLLTSVPGIGRIASLTLMAEIIDVNRFRNSEQFAAYIGIIPMCHSSGEHNGNGNITVRRQAALRSIVIESSWAAVRVDPALQLYYANNCKRMPAGKAIIKVARKLVNRIYCVLKNHQPYVYAVA